MSDGIHMRFVTVYLLVMLSSFAFAAPCSEVDRHLKNTARSTLITAIAKQLDVGTVDVLQSYRVNPWTIIYVDTHQADRVFLFFNGNPLTTHFITQWSGAAAYGEEQNINDWVLQNAPGIPARLAQCFAWHVTKDRDL
jgi:hypothetical protein